MAQDIENLVNMALRAGKLPFRIQDIYEGSDPARTALELFSQTRDELLDAKDWSFNRRTEPLVLLKGPPPPGGYSLLNPWSQSLSPAPGFLYEYAYPADAVDIRAIIAPPVGGMPDLDPLPAVWRIDNDPTPNVSGNPPVASGPEAKVIYCNVTNALGVYRSRVTNPAIFDPGFISAFVALLGKRFAGAFGAPTEETKEQLAEAVGAISNATDVRG